MIGLHNIILNILFILIDRSLEHATAADVLATRAPLTAAKPCARQRQLAMPGLTLRALALTFACLGQLVCLAHAAAAPAAAGASDTTTAGRAGTAADGASCSGRPRPVVAACVPRAAHDIPPCATADGNMD